jgi:hypothetical protein
LPNIESEIQKIVTMLSDKIDRQIQLQLSKSKSLNNDFVWTEAGPGNVYHPQSWVRSLDDTPEFFGRNNNLEEKLQKLGNVSEYLKYLIENDYFKTRKWDLAGVKDYIKEQHLSFLTFFDFSLLEDRAWNTQNVEDGCLSLALRSIIEPGYEKMVDILSDSVSYKL